MATGKTEAMGSALPCLDDVLDATGLAFWARRCGLDVDVATVRTLAERGLLEGRDGEACYGAVHLWVLARYVEAIQVAHHPFGGELSGAALAAERLGAVESFARKVGSAWRASAFGAVVEQLEDYLGEHDGLRSLRGVLSWVRPELLAGLRGEALLSTILLGCAVEMRQPREAEVEASGADVRPSESPRSEVPGGLDDGEPELEPSEFGHSRTTRPLPGMGGTRGPRSTSPLPRRTSLPSAAARGPAPASPASAPVGDAGAVAAPESAAAPVAVAAPVTPAAAASVAPAAPVVPAPAVRGDVAGASSARPASGAAAEAAAAVSHRPASPPPVPKVASEEPELARSSADSAAADSGRTTGLRAALQRTRAVPPSVSSVAARAQTPTAEGALPVVEVVEARKETASLREQVAELNRKRQEYIANNEWEKLVALYRDGVHLFSDPLERRQVLINIGAISEQQLGRTDAAIDAFEEALAIEGDSTVFNALYRLYEKARRRDDLMHCIERLLEDCGDVAWVFEVRVRRAELLVTELGREEEALALLQEVLSSDLSKDDREWTLDVLIGLLDAPDRTPRFLLDGTSLLEAYWSMGTHWTQMIEMYDRVFQNLAEQDLNVEAAEALSRMAAICQANDKLERAFDALTRSIPFHPTQRDTHRRLLRLAQKLGALDRLATVYDDELEGTLDDEVRASLGLALANVHESAGNQDGLREALRLVAEADPSNTSALMRLTQLDTTSGKLEALDLLRHHLTGDEKTAANLKIARLRAEGLFEAATAAEKAAVDVDTAIGALQEVFAQLGPDHAHAVEAMELGREIIRSDQQPAALQVAEMLEFYHRSQQDYVNLLVTWGTMVEVMERSPLRRVEAARLLVRMAVQREEMGEDDTAFALASRSLTTDSEEPDVFARLERLAARGDRWAALSATVDQVLDQPALPHRESWLRRSAELRRDRLEDADAAAQRFEALLELVPGDVDALEFLERHHGAKGDGESFLAMIDRKADGAPNAEARRTIWWEAAVKCALELGDVVGAGELLSRLVPHDDKPGATVSRIASVLAQASRMEVLEGVLGAMADRVDDPRQRTDLLMRRAKLLANDPARRADAAALFETLLDENDPDGPVATSVLPRLSDLYAVLGDKERCYQSLERQYEQLAARKLRSGRTVEEMQQLLARLASMAEEDLSDSPAAIRHLGALLRLDPTDRQTMGRLRQLHEAAEDWPSLVEATLVQCRAVAASGDRAGAVAMVEPLAELIRTRLRDPKREMEVLSLLDELGGEVDTAHFVRLATLAVQSGEPSQALAIWEGAVTTSTDPIEKAGFLRKMAQVARRHLHDDGGALDYFERARNLDPSSLETVHELAELYRAASRWRELTQLWMHTLDTNDNLAVGEGMEMCRSLARVLEDELGERRQAAGKLELALMLASDAEAGVWTSLRERVRRELIDLYQKLGESAAALTHLQEVEKGMRNSRGDRSAMALLLEEMGRSAALSGQSEAAERYYLQAIEENTSSSGSARLGLAESYLTVERWSEALELLTFLVQRLELLKTDEQRARVYAGLGRGYGATGKVGKAVEMFKVALQHDPNNKDAVEAMR